MVNQKCGVRAESVPGFRTQINQFRCVGVSAGGKCTLPQHYCMKLLSSDVAHVSFYVVAANRLRLTGYKTS